MVRVEGKRGGSIGGLSAVFSLVLSSVLFLLSVLTLVSSFLSYHNASAADILQKDFTNPSWVPGD